MKIIGITGGIGSGKSTVARILGDLGAGVVDADKVSKEVTTKDKPALEEIVELFGTGVVNNEGILDRKKLSDIVFTDRSKLETLNLITHKYIVDEIKVELEKLREAGVQIAVLDAPLPVEHGFLDMVEEVWVIVANSDLRIKRVMKRNNITREDALSRVKMQKRDEEYLKLADKVIKNEGGMEELEKEIAKLYIQVVQGSRTNLKETISS